MDDKIIRHAEGEERDNHKYVARVLLKKTSKGNTYRYFYDKESYQAYLKGEEEKKKEKEGNKLSDLVSKLFSGKGDSDKSEDGAKFLNNLFKAKDDSEDLVKEVKTKAAEITNKGEKKAESILNQNGDKTVGDLKDVGNAVLDFITTTLVKGIGTAVANTVIKAVDAIQDKIEEIKEEKEERERIEEESEVVEEPTQKAVDSEKQNQVNKEYEADRDKIDEWYISEYDRITAEYKSAIDNTLDNDAVKNALENTYKSDISNLKSEYRDKVESLNGEYFEKYPEQYHEIPDKVVNDYPDTGESSVEFPDLDRKDREYTKDEDQATVNPNYNQSAQIQAMLDYYAGDEDAYNKYLEENYEYNCSYCTATYDLRQRGYDVEAMPINMNEDDPTTATEIASWYEGGYDAFVNGYDVMEITQKQYDSMEPLQEKQVEDFIDALEEHEDGSYGHLLLYWAYDGGGHDVIWEIENGKAIVRDCQTNETLDPREYLADCYYADFFRSDNLELADEIQRVVRNRD